MKKLLLICYYFPPLGLGGINRPLNLFRKLPQHDIDCHILTVKPVTYRHYEPELLDALDKTKIHRSGSYDPGRVLYLAGIRRVGRMVNEGSRSASEKFFPDSKVGWVKPAVRRGGKLMQRHNFDVLMSTSPPISTHLVALRLAEKYHLPWIADFRDFWNSYRIEDTYENPRLVKQGQELLKTIREKAGAISVVNPTLEKYFNADAMIYNGYDAELAENWTVPGDNSVFNIGLMGHQINDRTIDPLLEVLSDFQKKSPEAFSRIRIIQVGRVDKHWFGELMNTYGLEGKYTVHGFQPRSEIFRILSVCHLFYIGLNAEREQSIMPGRMFDLLASGRPVMAYVRPESEIAHLLNATNAGFIFQDENKEQAVNYLRELINQTTLGNLSINTRPEYARPYSNKAMAERFAELINKI